MAEPGLSQAITLNLRNRTKILKDNISNNTAAFYYMKKADSFESVSGGRTLLEEMDYAELTGFKWYSGGEALNMADNPFATSAEFGWKQCAVSMSFTGLDLRINSGPEGVIKLMAAKTKAAERTIKNKVEASFWGDGTGSGGKEPGGLPLLVAKSPSSGEVGGIDRSTTGGAFYRNYSLAVVATFGSALSAANAQQVFNRVLVNTTLNEEALTVALLGNTYYEAIANAAQAKQHIVTDPDMPKILGGKGVVFSGVPCYLAGGVSFGGETQIPATQGYFINTKYLKLKHHKDCFMDPLSERESINQDASVSFIAAMYNFTLSNAKCQAVIYDS